LADFGQFDALSKRNMKVQLSLARAASFVKWQLVPIRYLGRMRYLRLHNMMPATPPRTALGQEIDSKGYATGPQIGASQLEAMQKIFLPRAPATAPAGTKAPFINLSRAEDMTQDNPLLQFAFSKEVLDVALDYFGKRLILDSLQVLHSFPQTAQLKESQKWHLDYGDSRSLHCVAYLNDVLDLEGGPFVFIDKAQSKKVGRGLIVRRIEDDQFAKESGGVQPQIAYGKAGSSVWVDPAVCYHYGSRCQKARNAVFVTFNSDTPFMSPVPMIVENAKKIAEVGKKLRPDLDPAIFDRMLRV
jgi:hypothetical protein